jgi:hypothetical protein
MIHSEFGRVLANASDGTDHGTAGPVFLLGRGVRGGFFGGEPSLTDLDDGDLKAGPTSALSTRHFLIKFWAPIRGASSTATAGTSTSSSASSGTALWHSSWCRWLCLNRPCARIRSKPPTTPLCATRGGTP